MTFTLYCVVNAVGNPYHDTFRPTSEEAWGVHRWRDVPKDGDHPNSCLGPTLEKHEADLRMRGDRLAKVHVDTHEQLEVTYEKLI